jgi:hypothetical protein
MQWYVWKYLGLGLLVVLLAGCTTVHPREPVGSGTYSYVSGRLSWVYPVPLTEAWQATLKALQELDLRVLNKTLDGLGGEIDAERADQTAVNVDLRPLSDRTTDVSVRIGTFGDYEQSKNVHEAIRILLKL